MSTPRTPTRGGRSTRTSAPRRHTVPALVILALAPAAHAGNTTVALAMDGQRIYVSSTLGSDAADGFTPGTAKRTLAAGHDLLHNRSPDQLLLRRGDVWLNQTPYPSDRTWHKSGLSAAQPIVIGAYGTANARPLIRTQSDAVRVQTSDGVSNVRFENLDFQALRTATNTPIGVTWWAAGGGFTMADCRVQGFALNLNIDAPSPMAAGGFRFERCEILDAFPGPAGPSQGAFVAHVHSVLFDRCVFDRNGYRYPDKPPTMLNHNCYFSQSATGIVIQDSIVARGSATGIQMRGQRMDSIRNLVLGNPLGITMGHSAQTPDQLSRGIIYGNAVIDGADIGWGAGTMPRGFGIGWGRATAAVIEDNIVAHGWTQSGTEPAYTVGDFALNTIVRGNVGFDWPGPIFSVRALLSPSAVIGDNTFVNMPGRTTASIDVPGAMPEDLGGIWTGNRYFGTGVRVFLPETTSASGLANWEASTDDVVEINDAGLTSADISMPTYLLTVAPELATPADATGALDVYLEHVRSTPIAEADPRFTAPAYIMWARGRLGLPPLHAVPQLP